MDHADYARVFYPNLTPTLSSMLRGCIVAEEGKSLCVGDFSSIEARVLLWCAGDTEGLAEYATGMDAYCSMAATVYKKTYKEIYEDYIATGNSDERQVGKKVILACFKHDTKVLTQRGFINIADVTSDDRVWDGEDWVENEGALWQGVKTVVDFHGVKVTPDHLILTPKGWVEVSQVLKESTSYLRSVVSLARLPLKALLTARGAAPLRLKYLVYVALSASTMCIPLTYLGVRVRAVMTALKGLRVSLINSISSMRPSCLTTSIGADSLTGLALYFQDATILKTPLTSTTVSAVLKYTPCGEKIGRLFLDTSSGLKTGTAPSMSLTVSTLIKGTYRKTSGLLRSAKTWLTGALSLKCRTRLKGYEELSNVYDLKNCGPRNRFTVLTAKGPVVVHNCGYQMGLKKFTSTLHDDGIFLPESVIAAAHKAFRDKYPLVPELWRRAENAAIKAVLNEGKVFTAGRCKYVVKRDFLTCILPSGRRLWYYKPEVVSEKTPWGAQQHKLYHWATNSKTKQWAYSSNYGGKLVENIVQAISRDCMTSSMIALEAAGYDITLTVHDEVITETTKDLETFKRIMATPPAWGLDIPLKVGAWQSDRYRK